MHHDDHDEPYIVIEKHSDGGVGNLMLGLLVGAGVALLFAPRSGEETRRDIRRRARVAGDTVRGVVEDATGQVADSFEGARARVEEQIENARFAIEQKRSQVARAMDAGREAAADARDELELKLAATKAAYRAGADVARTSRTGTTTTTAPFVDRQV